ncbi:MAG: EAL domain-containing protein [Ruminococcus sp.]|nr:EAL domain-containing protein [Ruminococcus sp.]
MQLKDKKIWLSFFGTAWQTLIEKTNRVGGFVALHDKKEVLIDKNAVRLWGFKHIPSYDELVQMLKSADNLDVMGVPISVHLLESSDELTAGFLNADDTDVAAMTEIYPLSAQSQLIVRMSDEDTGGSLLMLVKLEGIAEAYASSCIYSALETIKLTLPQNAVMAAHTNDDLWVYIPNFDGDAEQLALRLKKAVESCDITDEFGVLLTDAHFMSISVGISLTDNPPVQRMHSAGFALFEAVSKDKGSIMVFSPQRYELKKSEYGTIKRFSTLIDRNLFQYHFQPIVSARTGDIVAYEALMRTDSSIDMRPLEILDMAQKYGRLSDIETATFTNTMELLSENQSFFEERKLFINSISSSTLSDEDFEQIKFKYGELMGKVVVELTEQTELSDERLEAIKKRLSDAGMLIAIDDYGTGYSNTSNLLRYNPDYVKIDYSLVKDIDKNAKTQNIVAGIINFLHASGYIALGEGVETLEEMETLIEMGIDLLQGFYVSRPKPVLVNEVAKNVQTEIVRKNLQIASEVQKIYRITDKEKVDVNKLALERYTDIFFDSGSFSLEGDPNQAVKLTLTVKDKADAKITIKNVHIESETGAAAVKLGSDSRLNIICEGSNELERCGIFVPHGTAFRLSGVGNLSISPEAHDCYGIGNETEKTFGDILIDMDGRLEVNANGEKCVGIGGGSGGKITITGGDINVDCFGGNCLGIGSVKDGADVNFSDCSVRIKNSCATANGVGSLYGSAKASMKNFSFYCSCSGNKLCAVGSLEGSRSEVNLERGTFETVMKGKNIVCIGTTGGETDCRTMHIKLDLYAEGGRVSGVGDRTGGGNVSLNETDVNITFLTGDGFGIGSEKGSYEYNGGIHDIKINE